MITRPDRLLVEPKSYLFTNGSGIYLGVDTADAGGGFCTAAVIRVTGSGTFIIEKNAEVFEVAVKKDGFTLEH